MMEKDKNLFQRERETKIKQELIEEFRERSVLIQDKDEQWHDVVHKDMCIEMLENKLN